MVKKFHAISKYLIFIMTFLAFGGNAFALELVPLMSSKSKDPNRVWAGTFQLVWNDFVDGIVKAPVEFAGKKSALAEALNKNPFQASDLSPSSYYKTYGLVSPDLKKKTEQALKKKFNEKSDILSMLNWTPQPGKYLVYAMLKKDFKFPLPFDRLENEKFGGNPEKIKYFGINNNSGNNLREQVSVLFYNSHDDFAVKIRTSSADEIYLYRTNKDETFDKLYKKMTSQNGSDVFSPADELKIPDISLYALKSFDELCGRVIKNTDGLMISSALETVDFKLDDKGVKLKSEAATVTTKSLLIRDVKPRKFYFDDTFVLFLKEKGKERPYFALRVEDVTAINKTGK